MSTTLAPLRTIRVWTDPVPAGDAARLRISKGARVPARVVLLADDGQVFHAVRATIVLLDRSDDERGQVEVELAIECAAHVAKAQDHRDEPARRIFREAQPRPSRPAVFNGAKKDRARGEPKTEEASAFRARRLRAGISQSDLGARAQIQPVYVSQYEREGKVNSFALLKMVAALEAVERERGTNGHRVAAVGSKAH